MKKLFFLLLTVTFLAGCGARGEIKELAFKERALQDELQIIANDVEKNYSLWESGQISREQLGKNLSTHYDEVNTIKAKWTDAKKPLTRFAKSNAYYWKIAHMESLTTSIKTIIVFATQGYPSEVVESDKKPFTDQELTACYKNEISSFNKRMQSVRSEISQIID